MTADYRMDTNRRTGEPVCSRCGGDHHASLFADMSAQHRVIQAMVAEARRRANDPARHSAERDRWIYVEDGIRKIEDDLLPQRGDCSVRFAGSPRSAFSKRSESEQ